MIPVTVGLPSKRVGDPVWGEVQDWLCDQGWTPYLPQLRYTLSYNIGLQYDPRIPGLGWKGPWIREVRRFRAPMVYSYNAYYYRTNPASLRWEGRRQDSLSVEELTEYLRKTLDWFRARVTGEAWLFVDEPPHLARYGLTPEVEARVIKFVSAAEGAGWRVGVAMPGPGQLAFWRQRIHPTIWILNDKHPAAAWGKVTAKSAKEEGRRALAEDVWLYNAREFSGLGERMRAMEASGYLHFSAAWKVNPIVETTDKGWRVTEGGKRLMEELSSI